MDNTDGKQPYQKKKDLLLQDWFWWTVLLAVLVVISLCLGAAFWQVARGLKGAGPLAPFAIVLTPDPTYQPQAFETLTVAMDATLPPYEYLDQDTQQIIGFDVDLIRSIAERENLKIEIVNVSWDELMIGMGDCRYDLAISAIVVTPERSQAFLFSEPYVEDVNGPVAVAICRDRPDLQVAVNSGLESVRADGTLDALVEHWLLPVTP